MLSMLTTVASLPVGHMLGKLSMQAERCSVQPVRGPQRGLYSSCLLYAVATVLLLLLAQLTGCHGVSLQAVASAMLPGCARMYVRCVGLGH